MFERLSTRVTQAAGHPLATVGAFVLVLAWCVGGFFVGFSDSYQLLINSSTTVITFLMVFLIQSSQNRDTASVHAKLDEIIAALPTADNAVINADQLSDEALERLLADLRGRAT